MKNLLKLIALMLCLCMITGIFAGCGGEEESSSEDAPVSSSQEESEEESSEESQEDALELANTVWVCDDVEYSFYPDGTVNIDGATAYYVWDAPTGVGIISFDDFTVDIIAKDGTLLLEGEDGAYYKMESLGTIGFLAENGDTGVAREMDLVGTWIYSVDNNSYLTFDGYGIVISGELSGAEFGQYSYSYDGKIISFFNDEGESYSGYVDSDNDIILDDMEGYFELYTGDEEAGLSDVLTADDGSWECVYHGDDTMTYTDYVRNVSFTCPQWMTVITDGIGDTTDAVIVGDNNNGYVIGDNVTNEWFAYSGDNTMFLMDYLESYLPEFFEPLYGDWNDSTYSELESSESNRLATIELNLWNDQWDIKIIALLYELDNDSIMVKCFLAPYDNADQFQTLWDEVVSMVNAG